MRVHSIEKIEQLKKLRKEGHSIEDLVRMLLMPKTTIWHHIHSIRLRKEHILKLKANQGGSRLRKERDLVKAENEARILLNGKYKYLVSLLSMLYWAEGDNKNSLSFVNTSTEMIRMYLVVLEKCFHIDKDRLSITVRYFTGMDRIRCLNHWSKITRVPKRQINMYYNDGGKRGRTEFGMCRVVVRKSAYLLKIVRSLIVTISKEINAPVA